MWKFGRPVPQRTREPIMVGKRNKLARTWPPRLRDYDYSETLTWPDWAWEMLRRNPQYQRDARVHGYARNLKLNARPSITLHRARRRLPSAERWGLCSFRQPCRSSTDQSGRLDRCLWSTNYQCYCRSFKTPRNRRSRRGSPVSCRPRLYRPRWQSTCCVEFSAAARSVGCHRRIGHVLACCAGF